MCLLPFSTCSSLLHASSTPPPRSLATLSRPERFSRHSFETRVHRNELDPGPHPWCDSSGPWPTQECLLIVHRICAQDGDASLSLTLRATSQCCRTWLAHFLQADRTLSSQNRFRKSPAVRSIHRAVSRYTSICQCSRFSSLAAREIAPDRVLHPFFASTDQSLRFLPAVLLATVRVGHIREAGAVGSRTITG